MLQMPRSVRYVYQPQKLLKLNASIQFQIKIRKISLRRSPSPKSAKTGYFTLLYQRTGKECAKIYDA